MAIWKSRLYDQQVPRRRKSYQYIYSLGETHFGISVAGNAHREKGLTRATNLLLDHLASRAFSPFFFFGMNTKMRESRPLKTFSP